MAGALVTDPLLKPQQIPDLEEEWNADPFDELQQENTSLKQQLKIIIDENVRIETENRDLCKQLSVFREQSDQNASSLFLKTDTMSSLKRDANRLSAENTKLLKSARKSKARLKELDSEVSPLRD